MRSQGEWYLDPRTVTPVQSLAHLLPRLRQPAQSGCCRPPRAVGGCVQERGTDCAAVGLWSSDRGVAGTTYPCPAENTSHFPTSQGEPFVDQDRPPASQQARSSHLSAFNYSRPESSQAAAIAGRSGLIITTVKSECPLLDSVLLNRFGVRWIYLDAHHRHQCCRVPTRRGVGLPWLHVVAGCEDVVVPSPTA